MQNFIASVLPDCEKKISVTPRVLFVLLSTGLITSVKQGWARHSKILLFWPIGETIKIQNKDFFLNCKLTEDCWNMSGMVPQIIYTKSPLLHFVLNFLWGFCPLNFLFLWITHYEIIFSENVKRAKLSGMKFPIKKLPTCWLKPYTKAGNFPLKGRKLLFSLFKITFLNVSHQDYIFGENVKRKKFFPIKFSIKTLFTLRLRPQIRNFSVKGPKKEVRCRLQNNINVYMNLKRLHIWCFSFGDTAIYPKFAWKYCFCDF